MNPKNSKVIRIISIVALVAMAVFSVSLVLFFVDFDMGNGFVAGLALVSGVLGVGLFFVIKFMQREKQQPFTPPTDETEPDETEPDETELSAANEAESDESELPAANDAASGSPTGAP